MDIEQEKSLDLPSQPYAMDPDAGSHRWNAQMDTSSGDHNAANKFSHHLFTNTFAETPPAEDPKEYPQWNRHMDNVSPLLKEHPENPVTDVIPTKHPWSAPLQESSRPLNKPGSLLPVLRGTRVPIGNSFSQSSGFPAGMTSFHAIPPMPENSQYIGHYSQTGVNGLLSPPSQEDWSLHDFSNQIVNGTLTTPTWPVVNGDNPPGPLRTDSTPTNWFSAPFTTDPPAEPALAEIHSPHPNAPNCASGPPFTSFPSGTAFTAASSGRNDEYITTQGLADEAKTGNLDTVSTEGQAALGYYHAHVLQDLQCEGTTMMELFPDVTIPFFEVQNTYDAIEDLEALRLERSLEESQTTLTGNVQGNITLPDNVSSRNQIQQQQHQFNPGHGISTFSGMHEARNPAGYPATTQPSAVPTEAMPEPAAPEMSAFSTTTLLPVPSSLTPPLFGTTSLRRSYPCRWSDCGIKYRDNKSRWNHEQAIHIGIRHYCDHCDHSCLRKGNLRRHMKLKHGV